MFERTVSGITLTLLLTGMLTLAFNIQPVKASETIYIRADGSIDPPTANITIVDNVTYTFTDNIYDEIVVERDNIVVDGAGYTLQGTGSGIGINLTARSNVTIENMEITAFTRGIFLLFSSNNTVSGNNITPNKGWGIWLRQHSNFNSISGNSITNNDYGIWLDQSSNNSISGNNITKNNGYGIELSGSSKNIISGNNITKNNGYGIQLWDSSNYNNISGNNITNNKYGIELDWFSNYNTIYHNNFVDNSEQVYSDGSGNVWDDGYPSGGNYWSDYVGVDVKSGPDQDLHGSDGIGDTSYVIYANNVDHYPLMNPYGAPPPPAYALTITTTIGGTTDPPLGIYSYTTNSSIQVTAIPNPNFLFHHWELNDVDVGSANPYVVGMDKDHTLKAIFSPVPAIPVGGYSIPIGRYTAEKPLTLYFALIAILAASFIMIKRKTHKQIK